MRLSGCLMIAGPALLVAGCHPEAAPAPPRPPADGPCHADRVQHLVGTVITDARAQRARRRAGARLLRVLPPGSMMTMDYRPDRLNIMLGPDKVVTRINCG